jgi:predicted nuclease with TOPRIM domain
MEHVQRLREMVDALELSEVDDLHPHLSVLREGVSRLEDELRRLEAENRDLRLRGESLEQQVMELAREPIRDFAKNVILFSQLPDEDDEPDFDPAA